jgi:uncharacterized protein YndB with AHSA1/START domain
MEQLMAYSVTGGVAIQSPPHDVFAALADPQVQMTYDGEMMLAVEKLTAGPIGKGTTFRGKFKGMGSVDYTYAAFDEDRLIEHSVRMPFGPARHRFEFFQEGTGTRLQQTITAEPNLIGRLLWPIVIKGQCDKRIATLNARVKRHVEASRS